MSGELGDPTVSRAVAETNFHISRVSAGLIRILDLVAVRSRTVLGEGRRKSGHPLRTAKTHGSELGP
jgi:hypothetical protein